MTEKMLDNEKIRSFFNSYLYKTFKREGVF